MADKGSLEIRQEIMFYDTDCAGVVHNLAYLRFIEFARTKLAEKIGISLTEMAVTQLFPVVVKIEVDYKSPARLGDVLLVRGRMDSYDRVRFCFTFDVMNEADGRTVVTSRQRLAFVQMPQGRPVPLPELIEKQFPELRCQKVQ